MVDKRLAVGVGCMMVGGVLVVIGLCQIPIVPVVLIIMGAGLGFVGWTIFKKRAKKLPEGLNIG